jgi:IS30 family transposase
MRPNGSRNMTQAQVEKVIELRKAGHSARAIASQVGVHYATVYLVCKRAGLKNPDPYANVDTRPGKGRSVMRCESCGHLQFLGRGQTGGGFVGERSESDIGTR